MGKFGFVIGTVIFLTGCPQYKVLVEQNGVGEGEVVLVNNEYEYRNVVDRNVWVNVFYATNRKSVGGDGCAEKYGSERAVLSYGSCKVSIPPHHVIGKIESAKFFFQDESDVSSYIVVGDGESYSAEEFSSRIAQSANAGSRSSLIFVHGFNVSFEDAAKRTAQMAYDLNFQGAPIFYSWPSVGSISAYPADEATIGWAEADFYKFLVARLEQPEIDKFFLVAHSMGNRAVTDSLVRLADKRPDLAVKLEQVVLAAPDIDQGLFVDRILPELYKLGAPITLYASSNDRALKASKYFHSNPRAGDFGKVYTPYSGVEVVDASLIETDFLGHSVYGDSDVLLGDMFQMFGSGKRAAERFRMKKKETPLGDYWQLTR